MLLGHGGLASNEMIVLMGQAGMEVLLLIMEIERLRVLHTAWYTNLELVMHHTLFSFWVFDVCAI